MSEGAKPPPMLRISFIYFPTFAITSLRTLRQQLDLRTRSIVGSATLFFDGARCVGGRSPTNEDS